LRDCSWLCFASSAISVRERPIGTHMSDDDFCAITCLFNPGGYRTKTDNFARFRAGLAAQEVRCRIIECAFDDAPFALPASPDTLQVRATDVMWQKERLLNLAIHTLPAHIKKVAWLDGDILFANPRWARETRARLERFAVVQPFASVVRLPRDHGTFAGEGQHWEGFAAVHARDPEIFRRGDFDRHGHSGFAWAARREWIEEHGLYDACVAGSGDHMMAHAFAGDTSSACLDRILGRANPHRDFFADWCARVRPAIRGSIGFAPGAIYHLWHGEMANRRYVLRNRELADFDFDPRCDLRIGAMGCWEWTGPGGRLRQWARDYFCHRREDDPFPAC
jgi:hypothetical protein